MRRIAGSILFALVLTLASVGSALGHVHGVTPHGCEDGPPANSNAAAANTEDGRADSENGGPIQNGAIPLNTGNGQPGEAGQHSSLCDEEE